MKKITLIFVLILSFFFININVNADGITGGYSGQGKGQGYKGGKRCDAAGCKCTGGACLSAAAGIKFTLVDISNSKLEAKSYGYMRRNDNYYGKDYFDNRNYSGNGDKVVSGAIEGTILADGSYSHLAYSKDNYVELNTFSNMSEIIKNGEAGLNFYQDNLKKSILIDPECSSKGVKCILTNEFANISEVLLKKANILSSEDNLYSITPEQKNIISNLRIIIEPVYALFINGYPNERYIFSTPKSIAEKVASNDYYDKNPVLGIYDLGKNIYDQIYTIDTLKTIINYPDYIVPSNDEEKINAFLDLKTGAGYSIAKILYEDFKCDIKKDGETYTYVDSYGKTFDNDALGNNLKYYLNDVDSGCGCTDFNDSTYKDELLNSNEKFQEIYDSKCKAPEVKRCIYELNGANYVYYDDDGNKLSSYTDFIDKCFCNNESVIALKNTFEEQYKSKCPETPTIKEVESNLNDCTVQNNTEDYIIKKTDKKPINSYCDLTCIETINFNNVYGKYSVKAGQYFELGKYPELIATKKCSVNVKYTEWYNKYQIIATQQAKYMSEYNKHDAVTNAYSTTVCCPTGDGKCKPKTKYYTEVYDVYSFNGNSFSTTSAKEEWGGCAGTAAPYTNSSAGTAFYAKREDMQDLFSYLKTCSIYLDQLDGMNLVSDSTNETEFYTFEQELKYYYAQKYSIDGTTRFNNEKLNNVDDSLMKSTKDIDATTTDGNFEDYKDDERTYTYFSRLNSISHKAVGKSSYDTINRSVSFKYTYSPSVNKYSDIYTAKISDIEADLPNPINLGYVYDTDVTAITQPNNQNYFIFTKLGDDNTIYNWFTSGGKVILKNKTTNISTTIPNATEENLKRKCDYEIINDLFKTPNTKLNIIYRSVDPANIDPNERLKIDLDGDIGFSNWDNKKGYLVKKQIEETAKTRDTYNQDPNKGYLEYSFKLDSATIAAIRNYNEEQDNKYDKWDDSLFTCENGNECESDFITQAYNGTFKDKDNNSIPKFATDISGRNKWKYMTLDESSNTWSIENYERGIMGQDTFNEYKELLGGLTP